MLRVWERSVRATHHFLGEDDIDAIRPEVIAVFESAESIGLALRVCRDAEGRPIGFSGAVAGRLEMLFIDPGHAGRGLGRALLEQAIVESGVRETDVNEENPEALAFYRRMGFEAIGRSALDSAGRPFPLLHLELRQRAL
ncbi:GNAT family N-acetyltransferase [Chromobacterium alticapitis]|nr:GNAT family N-acetyltransferase [Chromobacterium alticapitis]